MAPRSSSAPAWMANLVLADDTDVFFIPNVKPDAGLSAPFNAWMTFFGQFFDHGLDLVTKGGNENIIIPLQPDDPLFVDGAPNFLILTRATQTITPGPDGILDDNPLTTDVDESADNGRESTNTTSPFVDQNQTYTSHPAHQFFLREYESKTVTDPVTGISHLEPFATGNLIEGSAGGMAKWADVKQQAREVLGINLTDANVFDVPLVLTDAYGNFIRGEHGMPQVIVKTAGGDGIFGNADDGTTIVEGNIASPIDVTHAVGTGHQFLIDVAPRCKRTSLIRGMVDLDPDGRPVPAVTKRTPKFRLPVIRQRTARRALHRRRWPSKREHRPYRGA